MDLHRLRVVEFDTLVSEQKGDNKYIPELEEPVEEDSKISSDDNKDKTNETESDIKGLGDAKSPAATSKLCQGDTKYSPGTSKKHIGDTNIPTVPSKKCAGDAPSPRGISSNKYKDDKNKHSGTSIKFLGNRLSRPGTSKKNLGAFLGLPGTSKGCAVDSTSAPGTSKNSTCSISRKSKSEIFRIPSKYKSRNREHKNNLSVVDITKLFHDSAQTRQKRRTLNLFNRKTRGDHQLGDGHARNEEVNFLFARDTPSFIRYSKRRAENDVKGKKRKRDTKLPSDIFGFQRNNRYIDPYLYQMTCNYMNTDKFPFKKLRKGFHRKPKEPVRSECVCKHHAMRVLNSGGQGEPPPPLLHYTINTHNPHLHKHHHRRDHDETLPRERVWFRGKDETVGVSPSSLSALVRCYCDALIGPSKTEVAACHSSGGPGPRGSPSPPDPLPEAPSAQSKPARKWIKKRYPKHSTPSPSTAGPSPAPKKPHAVASTNKRNTLKKSVVDASKTTHTQNRLFSGRWSNFIGTFQQKNLPQGKTCLKYVIVGLLIVVWSPCLLAVILAWVILCPIKMSNMMKTDTSKKSIPLINSFLNRFRKKSTESEYQRMCFENSLPANRSFMTSAASWYARAVGTVMNSFNAMVSLLKLKKAPTRADSSFLTPTHPNPRKKYTLFYADNRGWMMKPSRRRTRSYASTRVVQNMRCEFKPTFWCKTRNERVQTKKSTCKNIVHDCPVHGAQCIPNFAKHRSSPAGDANPILGNPQGCTCVNMFSRCTRKCSRDSSKFMASHRLQHQQVNIPQIYFQSTSGVIPSSTVQYTVNTYPMNTYQNGMVNKHICPTNQLSQRKNGTLPFGVNLKYPCGTKYPVITNLEKYRSQKFGLAGKTLNMSTKYTPSLIVKGLHENLAKYWTKHEARNTGKKSLGAHRINGLTEIKVNSQTKYSDSCKSNGFRGHTTSYEQSLKCPFGKNRKPLIAAIYKKRAVHEKRCMHNKCDITNISLSSLARQAETSNYRIKYVHKNPNTFKHTQTKNSNKTRADQALNYPRGDKPASPINTTLISDKILNPNKKQTLPFDKEANRKIDIALNCPCGAKNDLPTDKIHPTQKRLGPKKAVSPIKFEISSKIDIALNCPCGAEKSQKKDKIDRNQKQPSTADMTTSTKRDIAVNAPCDKKPIICDKKTLCIREQPATCEKETMPLPKKQDVAIQKQAITKENASQYVNQHPAVKDKSKEQISPKEESLKLTLDCACGSLTAVAEQPLKHQASPCACKTKAGTSLPNKKVEDCGCGSGKLSVAEQPLKHQASPCACKTKAGTSLPNKKVEDCGCGSGKLFDKPVADQPSKHQVEDCGCGSGKLFDKPVADQPSKHQVEDCGCGSGKLFDKPVADRSTKHQKSQCPCTPRQMVQTKQLSLQKKVLDCACGSGKLITEPGADQPSKNQASQCTCTTKASKSHEIVQSDKTLPNKKVEDCACGSGKARDIMQTKPSLSFKKVVDSTRGSNKLSSKSGIKLSLKTKNRRTQCVCKTKDSKTPEMVKTKQTSSLNKTEDCTCGSKKSITKTKPRTTPGMPNMSNTLQKRKIGSEPLHKKQDKYETTIPIKQRASIKEESKKSKKVESKVSHQNQSLPKVLSKCPCYCCPREPNLKCPRKLTDKMLSHSSNIEKQKSSSKQKAIQKRSSLEMAKALRCPCRPKQKQNKQIEHFNACVVQYPSKQKVGAVDSDWQPENKVGWESLYTNLTLLANGTDQDKPRNPQTPSHETARQCECPTNSKIKSDDNHKSKRYSSDVSSLRSLTSAQIVKRTSRKSVVVKTHREPPRAQPTNATTSADETNTSGKISEHPSRQQAVKPPFGVADDCPCGLPQQQVTTDNDSEQIAVDKRSAPIHKTLGLQEQSQSFGKHCECHKTKVANTPMSADETEKSDKMSENLSRQQAVKPLPTKSFGKRHCECQKTELANTTTSADETYTSSKTSEHVSRQQAIKPLPTKGQSQKDELVRQVSSHRLSSALLGVASDCPCGLTHEQVTNEKDYKQIAVDKQSARTHKPLQHVSRQQSIKALSTKSQPQKTELVRQVSSHRLNSSLLGIAADCPCGLPNDLKQTAVDKRSARIHKTLGLEAQIPTERKSQIYRPGVAEHPQSSKFSQTLSCITQKRSHTLGVILDQQPTTNLDYQCKKLQSPPLGIASDCVCPTEVPSLSASLRVQTSNQPKKASQMQSLTSQIFCSDLNIYNSRTILGESLASHRVKFSQTSHPKNTGKPPEKQVGNQISTKISQKIKSKISQIPSRISLNQFSPSKGQRAESVSKVLTQLKKSLNIQGQTPEKSTSIKLNSEDKYKCRFSLKEKETQSRSLAFNQLTNIESGQPDLRRYTNKNDMTEDKSQLADSSRQASGFAKLRGVYPTQDILTHTECTCSVVRFEPNEHGKQRIKNTCTCSHTTAFSKSALADLVPHINIEQSSLGSCDKSKCNCSGNQPSSRVTSSIISRHSTKVRELVKKLRSKLNKVSRRISQQKPKPRNEPNSIMKTRNVGDSSSKLSYKHVDKNHVDQLKCQNNLQIGGQPIRTSAYSNFSSYLSNNCRCRVSRTSLTKPDRSSLRSQNSQMSRYPSLTIYSGHSINHGTCFCRANFKTSSSKHSSSKTPRDMRQPLLVHKSYSNSTRSRLYSNDCHAETKTSKKSKSGTYTQRGTFSNLNKGNFRHGISQFPLTRLVMQQLSSTHNSPQRLERRSKLTQYPSLVDQIETSPKSQQFCTQPDKIEHIKSLNQNIPRYYQNPKYITSPYPPDALHPIVPIIPGMCRCATKQGVKAEYLRKTQLSNNNDDIPNEFNGQSQLRTQNGRGHRNMMTQFSSIFCRSPKGSPNQKSTVTQCPSLGKSYRSSSAANQTFFSQYNLSQETLRSKRSYFYDDRAHSNPLSEKFRFLSDKISPSVQSAPVIPGKCKCLSEKLHKHSEKLVHYESAVQEEPQLPHIITSEPEQLSLNSLSDHTTPIIIPGKCTCLSEKLNKHPENLARNKSAVEKEPLPLIITSEPTHEDGGSSKNTSKNDKQDSTGTVQSSELVRQVQSEQFVTSSELTSMSKFIESSQKMPKKSRNFSSQTHKRLNENQQPSRDHVLAPPISTTTGSERPSKFSQKLEARSDKQNELQGDPNEKYIMPRAAHSPDTSHLIIPGRCKCKSKSILAPEHSKKTETAINKPQLIDTDSQPSIKTNLVPDFENSNYFDSQPLKSQQPENQLSTSPIPNSLHKTMVETPVQQPDKSEGTPLQAPQPTHIIPGKCSCSTWSHGNAQEVVTLPENFQKSNLVSGVCTASSNRRRYSRLNASNYSYNNIDLITKRLGRQRIIIQRSEIQSPPLQPNLENQPVPSDPQSQPNPSEPQGQPNPSEPQSQPNPSEPQQPQKPTKPKKTQKPKKPQKPKKSLKTSKSQKVLEQNLQDPKQNPKLKGVLKRISCECPPGEQPQVSPDKIQRNAPVDIPPPGLLQRNASRHGRNAGDGVQQEYPDFNRVKLRYVGQNSGPNRSEPICPIAPAKNYQPAPGVSQPPNYARLPCFVNPANKCGPKSCFDEDALRRAYKRRPLRYTPPKQQVPNLAKLKQAKEKKLKQNTKKSQEECKKKDNGAPKNSGGTSCFHCVRDLVNKAEKEAWPIDVSCRPIWVHALKHRPCFWIYLRWPSIYPTFLSCYKFQRNLCHICTYCFAICVWCPMIFCFYLCSGLICKIF